LFTSEAHQETELGREMTDARCLESHQLALVVVATRNRSREEVKKKKKKKMNGSFFGNFFEGCDQRRRSDQGVTEDDDGAPIGAASTSHTHAHTVSYSSAPIESR
jgi:hypothetical protein